LLLGFIFIAFSHGFKFGLGPGEHHPERITTAGL
jgi:hypothetical protein